MAKQLERLSPEMSPGRVLVHCQPSRNGIGRPTSHANTPRVFSLTGTPPRMKVHDTPLLPLQGQYQSYQQWYSENEKEACQVSSILLERASQHGLSESAKGILENISKGRSLFAKE